MTTFLSDNWTIGAASLVLVICAAWYLERKRRPSIHDLHGRTCTIIQALRDAAEEEAERHQSVRADLEAVR